MKRIALNHPATQTDQITDLVRLVQEHVQMLEAGSHGAPPCKVDHAISVLTEAVRVLANTNTKGDRFGRLAEGVRYAVKYGPADDATAARQQLESLRDDFHHPDAEAILNNVAALGHFVAAVAACRSGKKRGYRRARWAKNGQRYWIQPLHECVRVACGEVRTHDTEVGYIEDFRNEAIR